MRAQGHRFTAQGMSADADHLPTVRAEPLPSTGLVAARTFKLGHGRNHLTRAPSCGRGHLHVPVSSGGKVTATVSRACWAPGASLSSRRPHPSCRWWLFLSMGCTAGPRLRAVSQLLRRAHGRASGAGAMTPGPSDCALGGWSSLSPA